MATCGRFCAVTRYVTIGILFHHRWLGFQAAAQGRRKNDAGNRLLNQLSFDKAVTPHDA